MTQAMKEFTERRKCREQSFIHFPRKESGMVWRDTPPLRSGDFELLLDCDWIKKG